MAVCCQADHEVALSNTVSELRSEMAQLQLQNDAALNEQLVLLKERDAALEEKDAALEEKDAAYKDALCQRDVLRVAFQTSEVKTLILIRFQAI